ncbi:MAG TPA: MBL fold metallo-hydrolase [Steroidobacteraceae bacterium]|jgi:cyclase|nr:MBL fold metallo-hydrolase [Steroidobacteraceae bacterium]
MDRRHFIREALPAATLGLSTLRWASAAEPTALAVVPLGTGLWAVTGGGGNVTVFQCAEGVLLVDGGSPERSAEVLQLVKARTGATRIHTLFNTHWHWDQTGSNRTLGSAGTRIIAHENTRLWLGTQIDCKWQNKVYPALPREARPNQTFYTTGTLSFGGEHIDYGYLPQAHTDGDIYVFFRNANVLVAGDVVSVGAYPIIDYSTNGWLGGLLEGSKTLIGLADANTRIVPGQGPVQSRADVEAERDMLATLKLRLSQLLAQGMSVQDMVAAAPTRAFDAHWGDPTLFISNAWPGLVQRARELGVNIV